MGVELTLMSVADAALQRMAQNPQSARAMVAEADAQDFPHVLPLEKEWALFERALTASGHRAVAELTLGSAGWTPVGSDIGGFGPARLLRACHVAEVAAVLEALSGEAIRACHPYWGAHVLAPGDPTWLREKVAEERAHELASVDALTRELTRFYRSAGGARLAVIAIFE